MEATSASGNILFFVPISTSAIWPYFTLQFLKLQFKNSTETHLPPRIQFEEYSESQRQCKESALLRESKMIDFEQFTNSQLISFQNLP